MFFLLGLSPTPPQIFRKTGKGGPRTYLGPIRGIPYSLFATPPFATRQRAPSSLRTAVRAIFLRGYLSDTQSNGKRLYDAPRLSRACSWCGYHVAVATSPEDQRLQRSDRAGQHRRWDRDRGRARTIRREYGEVAKARIQVPAARSVPLKTCNNRLLGREPKITTVSKISSGV